MDVEEAALALAASAAKKIPDTRIFSRLSIGGEPASSCIPGLPSCN